MVKINKIEATQKIDSASVESKFESANKARPPGKSAAMKQPSPAITLIIFI
jgi:hypothetical protein